MKISFLMPGYISGPSGGFRIVYEYANRLVARGHDVYVIHPRRVEGAPAMPVGNALHWARNKVESVTHWLSAPSIDWHNIDPRVRLLFIANASEANIPDADAILATAWFTVRPVMEYPATKGEKFYLIQGYETWMGPKEMVDATWRSAIHKVVIAKWLLELGKDLGCGDMAYIPNAIDRDKYSLQRPIEGRPGQVAMLFHEAKIKGAAEGIEAIRVVREKYPDLRFVMFGTSRRQAWVPKWAEYYRNPPQAFIVSEIYNKSSIFMTPSWTEGSPLPPAEAACCGCAIAGTDIGGLREFVENGVTGLLSSPRDPIAMANNILLLMGNDRLRISLAKACFERLAKFTWERSTAMLEDYLTRTVAAHSAKTESPYLPSS